jgi:hypothetical protein
MVFSLLPQVALAEESVSYTYGGDVTESGLDLTTAPNENKQYKAGDGVVLWQPGTNTLTLKGATIDTTTTGDAFALTLKYDADVTIVADGTNVLKSNTNGIRQKYWGEPGDPDPISTVIKGSGTIEVTSTGSDSWDSAIYLPYGPLTISGDVTVNPHNGLGTPEGLSILDNASVTAPSNIIINTSADKVNIDTTGTVSEFYNMSGGDLNYTKGDLKGAFVYVENNDGGTNRFYSVHGDYTLTTDETIQSSSGQHGLTVNEGATLTIPEGVTLTVEDETDDNLQITNNGTIENNGTIQFSDSATNGEILELAAGGTFTGSGTVKRGDTEVFPLNGGVYEVAANVTSTGLNILVPPTENTLYKAGSGYIVWEPVLTGGVVTGGILEMQDAEISSAFTALVLPEEDKSGIDVTIIANGDNSLITTGSNRDAIEHSYGNTTIAGQGTLTAKGTRSGIAGNLLTIDGNVTVNSTGGDIGIMANSIKILENASVTAASSSDNNNVCMTTNNGDITINTTGTVDAKIIVAMDNFNYTAGTMKGSEVIETKMDPGVCVYSVYGNYTLAGDEIINDLPKEDGLTVKNGATLTIPEGVTLTVEDRPDVEGVPQITTDGTIINNGTIAFPKGTTSAEIEALNIQGSGTIMIGDSQVAIINGVLYPVGNDISTTGLDLTVNIPTADTCYKAVSGYMMFSPSNGTLTLHNAVLSGDQDKPLITLPKSNIKLVLEGENALTNSGDPDSYAPIIQQGELINANGLSSAFTPQAYTLTVSGDGSLDVNSENSENSSISTDGTFIVESGTIKSRDVHESCYGIGTVDFKMIGGSLEASYGIRIFGNALIQGGAIFTPGGNLEIACLGNFEMTGGTVTCGNTMVGGLAVAGNINKTGGTLNALVSKVEIDSTQYNVTLTPYGSAPMFTYNNDGTVNQTQNLIIGKRPTDVMVMQIKLNIPSGSTLTIPSGAALDLNGFMRGLTLSDYVTNNGTLVNNGMIVLPEGSTADDVKAAVAILKPTGTGNIVVPNEEAPEFYTNSGDPMNIVNGLNLGEMETSGDGYTWAGNPTEGYTLTLDNLYVYGDSINLPENVPVTIVLNGSSFAQQGIGFTQSGEYGYKGDLTIEGSGTLTVGSGIHGSGCNGDKLTIQGGANVNVDGGIGLGGSGGADGTLIVDGTGTSLSVTGLGAYLDTLQVLNGAQMTVHSDKAGVFARGGGVTITGGSTLNAGCDYGVYIIDGKLTLDSTSKLVTNGAIAPFCVVKTPNSKLEGDPVVISNIPSGTQITSVQGTDEGYGYNTYWSLVSTGGTLGVKDEANELANLTGAVKGTVTFAASPNDSGDDNVDNNNKGGGGGSPTNYTITATAGEGGSISPNGKISIVSNGNKKITISANDGYVVKDVLVDGVSVGAVKEYTFDKVTKAHTITASFEKAVDETVDKTNNKPISYSDVKDSDWFKKAADYVSENGLMKGISDNAFGPNINATRGMIVAILWRLEGEPDVTSTVFTDVDQGDYYAKAVAWASKNKIVEGFGDGRFGPEDSITREQLAAILYRYAKFKGYDTTQGGMAVREFSDYGKISDWALESVAWAVNNDLLSGVGDNQLDPSGLATRAQVASILMRYCENIKK